MTVQDRCEDGDISLAGHDGAEATRCISAFFPPKPSRHGVSFNLSKPNYKISIMIVDAGNRIDMPLNRPVIGPSDVSVSWVCIYAHHLLPNDEFALHHAALALIAACAHIEHDAIDRAHLQVAGFWHEGFVGS